MLINWFTVGAQAINFLILVWLLKRFLYKPILHAIDEREKAIAIQLADAEAKKAEAQKERDDFQRKNEAFDQQRAENMKRAADEGNAERRRLLDLAHADADALRAKRHEALQTEQRNLGLEITRWAQKEVFAIARKTLADLAGMNLEERMSDVFVGRLRDLNGAAKEQLAAGLKTSTQPAIVRSAYDLAPAQRTAIENAVKDTLAGTRQLQFQVASELVSGIELSVNGLKVAWSIADYLSTLETKVGELRYENGKPESNAEVKFKPEPKVEAKANTNAIA
jgi:F-type H+-transporting ATPase subunit b